MAAPLVAVVGRPNVGKSTLYNRLVGGRPALVHDAPGLTRDRRYGEVDYFGRHFRLVDTGGLDPEVDREVIGAGIHRQAYAAMAEADAVLFVVDVTAGVTPLDHEVASLIRKLGKPVFLAANKADGPKRDKGLADLFELGMGDPHPISAAHGRGIDELLDALCEELDIPVQHPDVLDALEASDEKSSEADRDEERPLRIALIGKPNAGKSSLLNRLTGGERSLVHDQPGTTTDPVDTAIEFGGVRYTLVDTAGIRRRPKVERGIERISVSLALSQIERADLVVMVIDSTLGPSEQDARIARRVIDAGRALVLGLNKMDLVQGDGARKKLDQQIDDELHFLGFVPRAFFSAARGDGVVQLFDTINSAAAQHRRRIPTAEINRFFAEICETHPPPVRGVKRVTIHYITQGGVAPPTFLLFANHPDAIEPPYRRFVENQLRARYGFRGTPVRVVVKAKSGQKQKRGRKKRGRRKGARRR